MPKRIFVKVKLPPQQPDRCLDCPLLGLIPEEERKHNSKKTYVCMKMAKALAGRKEGEDPCEQRRQEQEAGKTV